HMLKEKYEQIGFIVSEQENQEIGNHLVLQHKEAKDPEILIMAHMDTVFPRGTAKERPFSIRDGKAYGPGVIDMKASKLCCYTLKALIVKQIPGYKNVEIVLNSDEEIGTVSSRPLIEEKAKG